MTIKPWTDYFLDMAKTCATRSNCLRAHVGAVIVGEDKKIKATGYKYSTRIAKEAMATGKSIYDLVLDHDILTKEDLDTILSPENMIKPVKLDIKPLKQL